MAGSDFSFDSARIGQDGASSITWQAVCGTSVADWVKTNKAIISVFITSASHTPASEALKLRWKNLTDGGSFADLTTSGELQRGVSAGCITNADPVGSSAGCQTADNDEEVENETPLLSGSLTCNQNGFIETQWCVDFANALDNKQYQFEIYSETETAAIGTLTVTITTEAGVTVVNFSDTLALTSLTSDAKFHLVKVFADILALTSLTSDPALSGLTIDFSDVLALTSLTSDPKLFKLVEFLDTLALTSLTSDPKLFKLVDFIDTLALTSLTSDAKLYKLVDFLDTLALTSLTSDPALSGLTVDFSDTLNLTSLTSAPKLYKLVSGFVDSLALTSLTSDAKLFLVQDFLDTLDLTSLTSDPNLTLPGDTIDFSGILNLTSLTSDAKLNLIKIFADALALSSLTSNPALSRIGPSVEIVLHELYEYIKMHHEITEYVKASTISDDYINQNIDLEEL